MTAFQSVSRRGRVICGLPRSLKFCNAVTIGSARGSDIVIDGADPHHAELRWNEAREVWYLHDDPAPGETILNGEVVESMAIRDGDWFDIAGVRIRFSGGSLVELNPERPTGLRLTLRHVSAFADGARRLDDVSFQIMEGEFVALLGSSGCGKSTLIQRIAGLAGYDGEIRFNGHDLKAERETLRPLVAYLPQKVDDTFNVGMTVGQTMEDFRRRHLASKVPVDFAAILDGVGLDWQKFAPRPVAKLSGGEKRRLALALELMRDPQLLILDEPTAGLDPAAEAGVMKLLRNLAGQGRTVLCATHVLASLDKCDSVVLLAPGGRVAASGAPADVMAGFGASDWQSIYEGIPKMDGNHGGYATPDDPAPRRLPSPPPAASSRSAFLAVLDNLVRSALRNVRTFFGAPVIVGVLLAVICRPMFHDANKLDTVCFCMVLAMFWFGLGGSVRNLVSDRVPRRCLDRMRGFTLVRYFLAHVAFAAFTALAQSIPFTFVVFLLAHNDCFPWKAVSDFMPSLALVAFAGGCVGLAVSAWVRRELQAVWMLPLIAILALFFSNPVLEYEHGRKPAQPLRALGCVFPTIYAQQFLLDDLECHRTGKAGNDCGRDLANFLILLLLGYPLVTLPLAYLVQNNNERKWDGR